MEQTEEKIIKAKAYNAKIFPMYKMFAWDLLFYYSICFLFLTQNKGLSAADVLLAEAFYPLTKLLFQIPGVNLIEMLGKRKSLILGNVIITIAIAELLLGNGIYCAILFNVLIAIGYSIKGICESIILNDCVSYRENSRTVFSSIDGKGSAYWYYFDGITTVFCGFLYVFNNYLPMIFSLIASVIGILISFKFLPYEDESKKAILDETKSFKVYFKNLRIAFKNIFKSNRLKSLLLFSGVFSALLTIRSTIASSLFSDIGVKEEYFGVIFAVLTIISGFSSKYQDFFHKKYRNRLLTNFSLTFSISMIVIGLTCVASKNFTFMMVIVLIGYTLQYIIKGPYYTLQKRYLNSFSSPTMATKIYSANILVEGLFDTFMYLICALLLTYTNTATTITILGCIFTIAFVFILDYMKTRIGLKPEEYKKSDISFTEVH